MGLSQRNKGARFERSVVNTFKDAFADRDGVARAGMAQGFGGQAFPDVFVPGHPSLWVECKVGGPARYPVKALAQATGDLGRRDRAKFVPVAVTKIDRYAPKATLGLPDLFLLAGVPDACPRDCSATVTLDFDAFVAFVGSRI